MIPTPAVGDAFHEAVSCFKFRFSARNEKRWKLAEVFLQNGRKSRSTLHQSHQQGWGLVLVTWNTFVYADKRTHKHTPHPQCIETRTLPCVTVRFPLSPCVTVHYPALPCCTMRYHVFPLCYFVLRCITIRVSGRKAMQGQAGETASAIPRG